jgi:hypothetical protein
MLIHIRILLSKPCKDIQKGSYSINFGCVVEPNIHVSASFGKLDPDPDPAHHFDGDPDPTFQCNAYPQHLHLSTTYSFGSATSLSFLCGSGSFPCCADPCGSRLGTATRVSNVITKLWIRICIRIDLHYLSRRNRIQIRIQKADRDPDLGGQNSTT